MEGNGPVDIKLADRASACDFIRRTLVRFGYLAEGKVAKGLPRAYLGKPIRQSRAQLARLIRQHRETGPVADRRRGPSAMSLWRRHTHADIRLLVVLNGVFGRMAGRATRKPLRLMAGVFGERQCPDPQGWPAAGTACVKWGPERVVAKAGCLNRKFVELVDEERRDLG